MDVTVRYYAAARAASGIEEERVDVPDPASVHDLARHLAARHGGELARVLELSSFLVDGVPGGTERLLPAGSAVDVLPPFAGG